jgi:hypothetical protein
LFFRKTAYRKPSLPLGILLFLSISLPVHFLITLPMESSISMKNGTYRISDFYYYILVVKSFWAGETNSIYTLESNLRAMSSFFGQEIKYAMPIGVSPTALLIWLPFSYVAIYSLSLANTAWVSFSLTVFTMSIIIARRTLYSLNPYFSHIFLFVTSLFFLSFAFQACIHMGNTSVLASGIFILLMMILYSQTNTNFIKKSVLILFYLIILSIKMPYLVIALILLLIFGYVLEFILSSGIIFFLFILLNLFLGTGLIREWFGALPNYFLESVPVYYASSFDMTTFVTFRSAFSMFLGPLPTMVVSQLFLFGGCIGILFISATRHIIPLQSIGQRIFPTKVSEAFLSVFLFSITLLFLPYIVGSEDLLIIVCFFIVLLYSSEQNFQKHFFYIASLCAILLLNHNAMPLPKPIWLFWCIKTALFINLLLILKNRRIGERINL